MRASILGKLKHSTPLESMKRIKAGGGSKKDKSLLFSLNLTTLIDAFCILVIFLLSNMNGRAQQLQTGEKIVLPAAVKTDELTEGLNVRIEGDDFYLNDKKVAKADVPKAIFEAKRDAKENDKLAMIIQADRKADYENIGIALRVGGQAGFEKYVFAVIPGI